jgi:AbrB family looped-hinge helix DNA binding protein
LPIKIAIAKYKWHNITVKLKLDKLGRVVLPKPLRIRYGLRPGTELEVHEAGDEFALRPAAVKPSLVNEQGVWVHQGIPEGEVDFEKALRDDREERLRKLGGMG